MKTSGNNNTILIIPAYNEQHTIKNVVEEIKQAGYNYIVINDGSTDNTEQVLTNNNIEHITLTTNLGIGGAVQTGYKYACQNNYDIAIQFDADGQHDISFINNLIKPIINKEANLVIGSCFIDKKFSGKRSSKLRSIGISFLSNFIFILSGGKRIHDVTSGFRAADKKVIKFFSENYPLEYPEPVSNYELLRLHEYTIKEIPVKMHKRAGGKSSIRSWKNTYAAFNVMLSLIIISIRRKND